MSIQGAGSLPPLPANISVAPLTMFHSLSTVLAPAPIGDVSKRYLPAELDADFRRGAISGTVNLLLGSVRR